MVQDLKRNDNITKLSSIQKGIENAIRSDNPVMLKDFGAAEQTDINFWIEIERNSLARRSKRATVSEWRPSLMDGGFLKVTPIILAASMGRPKVLEVLLRNLGVNLDICEETSGVNAFWFAAFFGRGKCLKLLAEAGINIITKHKETG